MNVVTIGVGLLITSFAAEPRCIEPNVQPGQSLAVAVEGGPLVHTAQLLPLSPGALPTPPDEQVREVFSRLDSVLRTAGSQLSRAVKLNVYVSHPTVTPQVERELKSRFAGKHQPAVSFVQTNLPQPGVMVAIDAVATTDKTPASVELGKPSSSTQPAPWSVLPLDGAVYISGQAEKGDGKLADATTKTMESLFATLTSLELTPADVVSVKAFLTPMTDSATAVRQIRAAFGKAITPPIALVEWESSLPIEIELVAASKATTDRPRVEYLTPPGMTASPVFCRVVRVNVPQTIYVSGLFGTQKDPNSADEVRDLFTTLQRVVEAGGSDLKHLAKATYYVSDDKVSQAHNEVRKEVYDPERPPAASKAKVQGTGKAGRTITMDLIAVPKE